MTDISKNIVVVLIVAALVISVAGTWVVSEKLGVEKERAEELAKDLKNDVDLVSSQQGSTGNNAGNIAFTIMK
jgi:type II secretory pathway pseudopilin PulG